LCWQCTEFIPDAWFSERAHPDFGARISVAIPACDIVVNVDFLTRSSHAFTLVLELNWLCRVIAILFDVDHLRHNDIAVIQLCIFGDESTRVNLVVIAILDTLGFGGVRFATAHETGDVLVLVLFRVVNRSGKHSAVNGTLVYQHTVFLVIAGIRHNGYMDDLAGWNFDQVEPVHDACIHQRS
jgi:hypothetical protein